MAAVAINVATLICAVTSDSYPSRNVNWDFITHNGKVWLFRPPKIRKLYQPPYGNPGERLQGVCSANTVSHWQDLWRAQQGAVQDDYDAGFGSRAEVTATLVVPARHADPGCAAESASSCSWILSSPSIPDFPTIFRISIFCRRSVWSSFIHDPFFQPGK